MSSKKSKRKKEYLEREAKRNRQKASNEVFYNINLSLRERMTLLQPQHPQNSEYFTFFKRYPFKP